MVAFFERPSRAVLVCVGIGLIAIAIAVHYGSDKGSVAIAGIGALGQVIVAILLYYLTREQLTHTRLESKYRRMEQNISKRERSLDDMRRMQVAFRNAKTGIGKTRCDTEQIARLDGLRDKIGVIFAQPVNTDFNLMRTAAIEAAKLKIGEKAYLDHITKYAEISSRVWLEMKRQVEDKYGELVVAQKESAVYVDDDSPARR